MIVCLAAAIAVAGPLRAATSGQHSTFSADSVLYDVSAVRFLAPTGTIDSGGALAPRVWIKNLGDTAATFPVVIHIGSTYLDTMTTTLSAGDSVVDTFPVWTALIRGSTLARCSTLYHLDENHTNDRCTSAVTVRVRDVGVIQMIAPHGAIDSGTVVTPAARIENFGTGDASFTADFRVDSVYAGTRNFVTLAPGAETLLTFPTWTASETGRHVVKCTTAYNNDVYPANNFMFDSCTVFVMPYDVGVSRIIQPSGIYDTGSVVAPAAMVSNYGRDTATFPVIFRISTFYADTEHVTKLGRGDSAQVNFRNWTAVKLGSFQAKCSTALSGDSQPANDARTDSVKVIDLNYDAGVTRIIAPAVSIDSNTSVIPQAEVKNFADSTISFPVILKISSTGYIDTEHVATLHGFDSATVSFRSWTALSRGNKTIRCTTALSGDQIPGNNVLSAAITVVVRDVGVRGISGATGAQDSGSVVTPSASIVNNGNTTDSFPVVFRIGSFYSDTERTNGGGGPGGLAFRPCTLRLDGTFPVKCSTMLPHDMNPANDFVSETLAVRVLGRDVGVEEILTPNGTLDSGTVVAPQLFVHNYGSRNATFPVWLRITTAASRSLLTANRLPPGQSSISNHQSVIINRSQSATLGSFPYSYQESVWVSLTPLESTVVTMPNWIAAPQDTYGATAFSVLASDTNPGNDTAPRRLVVVGPAFHDVGIVALVAPQIIVHLGDTVIPRAAIENFGSAPEIFRVRFAIGTDWRDSILDTLPYKATDTVSFRRWLADSVASYEVRCTTALAGDMNPSNNLIDDTVFVINEGIEESGRVPAAPRTTQLMGGAPNPFKTGTAISFGLAKQEYFGLSLYNASGELVQILTSGTARPGYYTVNWNGRDMQKRAAPRGIYFCRLETGSTELTMKLVKLD
jgi:hypothetical protein